eukprot:10763866-Prorocentrum_lima.AAC.1
MQPEGSAGLDRTTEMQNNARPHPNSASHPSAQTDPREGSQITQGDTAPKEQQVPMLLLPRGQQAPKGQPR